MAQWNGNNNTMSSGRGWSASRANAAGGEWTGIYGLHEGGKPWVYNISPSPLYTTGVFHMIGDDNWEPQRTNNFELHVYGLSKNIYTPDKGIMIGGNPEQTLTLSLASIGSISQNVSSLPVRYGNTEIKFAGVPTQGDFQATINDYIGKGTERIIAAWHNAVANWGTQKVGMASDYKKSAAIIETAPDGSHYRVWKLFGLFPRDVDYGSYDYNSNGIKQIQVTFSCDAAKPLDEWTSAWEVHKTSWI